MIRRSLKQGRARSALWFVVTLVGVVGVTLIILPNAQALAWAASSLGSIAIWLMVLRLSVILLVWCYWSPIVDGYFGGANPDGAAVIKARRNSLAMMFVAIELALVQNVFGHLWSAFD